ncbi:MEKHLA domain-containing protein [Synechococcus sp. BSF8S]|uniref:MEKHLA domain-containing protein n=1 Tax=Synechococcales TaxID=1890424 RepID=UPI001627C825|nr:MULTISPECIES: MEKHLA domain-containing protein [unclassified Synechococcus]MBC1260506.1 MEKHLA domain-containing protein [Synechococcus sp. BSF8S]MBC1263877.1 MEKHLA domain-containing protein [Synechococcus sp. BSA11S]
MPVTEPGSPPGEAPWLSPGAIEQATWLQHSHQRAFGRPLIAATTTSSSSWLCSPGCPEPSKGAARQRAQELFAASTVVLAHDGNAERLDHDPRLIYANRAALVLWHRPWAEMVGMPSRLTAEPAERSGRARLLASARAQEAISGYTGIRIDSHGRRFVISGARLWTLRDLQGRDRGQAAAFSNWWWLPEAPLPVLPPALV